MKNLTILFLAFLMSFSLFAKDGENESNNVEATAETVDYSLKDEDATQMDVWESFTMDLMFIRTEYHETEDSPEDEEDPIDDVPIDDDDSIDEPIIIYNDERKYWYKDEDSDGWYVDKRYSNEDLVGQGYVLDNGQIKGEGDCDDNPSTGADVHELNSCGKCEKEPTSTDWSIEDLVKNATGLLKELIDKANETAPNLSIDKYAPNGTGANTLIAGCNKIRIGTGVNHLESSSKLAFELSHIINDEKEDYLKAVFAVNLDNYINKVARFEAQGSIFSKIIKTEQLKNLNDCEKGLLGNIGTLDNDYSGKTVDEIKSLIKENGELESEAQKIINSNNKLPTSGLPFKQHNARYYNQWQEYIKFYRDQNKTNEAIYNIYLNSINCN